MRKRRPDLPTKEDFRNELRSQLRIAERQGLSAVDVNAGTLHRKLGGYPATVHQMPSCCDAMYDEMGPWDIRLPGGPKKGRGASLTIRYVLPREYDDTQSRRRAGPAVALGMVIMATAFDALGMVIMATGFNALA
jgi:5-methylcytosine-specific restriction protein A